MASRKSDILRKLAGLADAENAFLRAQFIAAVSGGDKVAVKIAGIRCELSVEPRSFDGFGMFKPVSHTAARLVRPASLAERQAYLALFPAVRLVLCERSGGSALGILASRGDTRFTLDAPASIHHVEQAELFDSVVARYDGVRFWFDQPDPRSPPATGRYLREAILQMRPTKEIDCPGSTAEQREAYRINLDARLALIERQRQHEISARRETAEGRISEALEHAGGELREFIEQRDAYRVRYVVDGQEHLSVVSRRDLTVLSAGICLSGEDDKFDLASLVSVVRGW